MFQTKEVEELKKEVKETNAEATDRICKELRAKRKLDERRQVVMNYFFELTGIPMTEEQFLKYNKIFDDPDTPAGYNIQSFIIDEQIKKEPPMTDAEVEAILKEEQEAVPREYNIKIKKEQNETNPN